jgi:phosphoribosylglycinamide formyltransferase 2
MHPAHLVEAQEMAAKVTAALGGAGIWGVEFFITKEGAYFSESSPRPHDTGMVTLAGTQNFSEFELHARAVLGLFIPEVTLLRNGASAVVLATQNSESAPNYLGLDKVLEDPNAEVRIFGKPTTRPYRRMAVTLTFGPGNVKDLVAQAQTHAANIQLAYKIDQID